MKARQRSPTVQSVRKKKFAGKKTKWEKRRIVRRITRTAKGKKPLVEPLTIAPKQERQAAFKKGKMIFYDGMERLEAPLYANKRPAVLAGVFKLREPDKPPDYVLLRFNPLSRLIEIIMTKKEGNILKDMYSIGFAFVEPDLGHMEVNPKYQQRHLALKAVSKAERHMRSGKEGSHRLIIECETFQELFEKLGYRGNSALKEVSELRSKTGKHQPKDNLLNYIRIEAIDPKTGKARMFTFPVKKSSSK